MRRIKIICMMLCFMLLLLGCKSKKGETYSLDTATVDAVEESAEEDSEHTAEIEYIYVYVCGAVNQEGVYELPNGSRVYEAIEMAGGFREDADTRSVNQAQMLVDEERIYVSAIGEEGTIEESDGKVNINKASKEELMTLPGVGASRAESIMKYREEHGRFQSIEDIKKISGIKEGLFEKIKDLITI